MGDKEGRRTCFYQVASYSCQWGSHHLVEEATWVSSSRWHSKDKCYHVPLRNQSLLPQLKPNRLHQDTSFLTTPMTSFTLATQAMATRFNRPYLFLLSYPALPKLSLLVPPALTTSHPPPPLPHPVLIWHYGQKNVRITKLMKQGPSMTFGYYIVCINFPLLL